MLLKCLIPPFGWEAHLLTDFSEGFYVQCPWCPYLLQGSLSTWVLKGNMAGCEICGSPFHFSEFLVGLYCVFCQGSGSLTPIWPCFLLLVILVFFAWRLWKWFALFLFSYNFYRIHLEVFTFTDHKPFHYTESSILLFLVYVLRLLCIDSSVPFFLFFTESKVCASMCI